ncbi:hypothetical protein, conserved [Trypanosoma cruzi]|uniref:Uncharacterized protein n=1 Tax=Trypanosoma cruzi (strain CL Brener) TaxID=353153 RepID=Q4CZB3_TRYCC|nr:hypothetical protein, conserved [Trypanosoma cruzi]EAN85619.1 hypothetical protein, conserved [Trypanosoma cruzi]|eukprot:XP_807470.1 hypothetical protein [Trypanosoma cruzi strain CL Brener]
MLTAFIRQTATLRAAYLPLAAAYTSSSSSPSTSNPSAVVATTGNATPITATGMTNATERVRSLPGAVVGGGVGAGNDTMPLVGDPRVSIWRDEEALLRASLGRLEAERELARMRRRCEDELHSLREGLKVREGQVARIVRRVITRTPAKSRRGRHAHVVANNINSTHDTAISCVESGGEEVVAATDECEGHGATVMTQDEAHTEEICRPAHPGRANKKEKAHRITLGNAGALEVEELDGKGRVKDGNNEVEGANDAERSEGSNSFSGDDAADNADGDGTGTTVPSGMELKMSLTGTRRGGLAGGTVHVGSNATVTSTAGGKRQAATASTNGELTKDAVGRRGRRRAGTTKKGTGSNNNKNNSSSSSSTKNKNKKRETGRSPAKNKKAVVKTLTKQRINSKGRTVSHNAPSSKKKVQPKPRVKTGHPTPKRKTSSSMRKQPKKQDHKNNKSKQSSLNKKGNGHTKKTTKTRQRK